MPAERPIFIVGAPRSGTTLLRYMLCSHPRIYIPPESNFIPRFFRRRPGAPMNRRQAIQVLATIFRQRLFIKDWQRSIPEPTVFVDGLPDLTPATFLDTLYSQYASQYGAARWGDKSPIYTGYMDLIAEIFPSAQFVHLIRDGRDVALSTIASYKDRFYVDLYFAARTWRQRIRKAFESASRLDSARYHEVRYEQLAADPEGELRKICGFLGEEYLPAMTEPHKIAQQLHPSQGIHSATRQPPTTQSSGRWRKEMCGADQRLFQAVAGDLLNELGYGTVGLGDMSVAERAHHVGLKIKYTVLEDARRILQTVGVFPPH